jgi:hypothetical protein
MEVPADPQSATGQQIRWRSRLSGETELKSTPQKNTEKACF